jgi:hypothetical protein
MSYDDRFFQKLQRVRGWQNIVGAKIIEHWKFKSVIDFGCGNGFYLEGMQREGALIKGLEMNLEAAKKYIPESVLPFVEQADLSKPMSFNGFYNCAMSCEVGEHLPESCATEYVRQICCASNFIIFSAAIIGQTGDGHINEQDPQYWIDKFEAYKFFYSPDDTKKIKDIFRGLPEKTKYTQVMKRNIYVMRWQ